MPYCPLCDVKFKNRAGLQGHFRFKHKIELETGRPARETVLTKAIGKQIERGRSGDVLMKELERAKSESRDEGLEEVKRQEEKKSGVLNFKGLKAGRWL